MKKDPLIFIKHVLESIKNIESFSKGLSKIGFMKDKLRQNAIIRELEIIGEAVKNIPENFRSKYPNIEWTKISGTRDKIIHHYFGINFNTVWDILQYDLPKLKKDIGDILGKEK